MEKNKLNISPVISPDILKTISASTIIKTFGDQLKDKAKETIISVSKNKVTELEAEVEAIVAKKIKLGISHSNELKRLDSLHQQKQITDEKYEKAVEAENASYQTQLALLNKEELQLKDNITKIVSDPYKKLKDKSKAFKNKIKQSRKKIQDAESKSKTKLTKQVVSNAVKSLAPLIGLQLANQFTSIISQRKKLENLVDQINDYIDTQVKDEQTISIATNLRNNAITIINNNIKKLQNLEKILETITVIITIFSLILRIISLINIPITSTVADKLVKASNLILGLSALLAMATVLLSNEIIKLNELIERLKQASLKLDGKSLDNLSSLSNEFLPLGGYGSYKGFKFAIKEEQNQAFVVKGNKRRYAVAIDRYGVETIKSELSFTLDPNDLIEQLKLVIDQRNLQG